MNERHDEPRDWNAGRLIIPPSVDEYCNAKDREAKWRAMAIIELAAIGLLVFLMIVR